MTKIIIIGLLVLAVIVLAVWALILMARKDLLDRMEVRIEEKEERLNKHLELLEAERATLENRKKEIAAWERQVIINGHKFVYDEGAIRVEGKK